MLIGYSTAAYQLTLQGFETLGELILKPEATFNEN
jgi:hypothetical protein